MANAPIVFYVSYRDIDWRFELLWRLYWHILSRERDKNSNHWSSRLCWHSSTVLCAQAWNKYFELLKHMNPDLHIDINEYCFRPRFWTCKTILGREQPRLMRWILLWIMPLVQDRMLIPVDQQSSALPLYHIPRYMDTEIHSEIQRCIKQLYN